MNHTKSLVTVAEALQRVFHFPPQVPRHSSFPPKHQISSRRGHPRHVGWSASSRERPGAAQSPPQRFSKPFKSKETDISKYGPSSQKGPLRDEAIKAFRAYMRQSDGKLSEAMSFQDILDLRQSDEQGKYIDFVEMLAAADGNRIYPIVHIRSKKKVKEEEKAKKQALRESKIGKKYIELSWSIGENDLGHRLHKMKDFLGRGAQVEVLVGSRRLRGWKQKANQSKEVGQHLVDKIRQAALEVQGAKERAEPQGQILDQVTLSFECSEKKRKAAVDSSAEESSSTQSNA